MGNAGSDQFTTISDGVYDQADAPLPPPRIINSVTAMVIPRVAEPGRTVAPKDVGVRKQSIPFMINRDSIECVEFEEGSVLLKFQYRSDVPLSVFAELKSIKQSSSLLPSHGMTNGSIKITGETDCYGRIEMVMTNEKNSLIIVINKRLVERITWTSDGNSVDILGLYTGDSSVGTCVVCMSGQATVGFLPCRHVCVCSACAKLTLESTQNQCPLCRCVVSGRINLQ